MEAVLLPDVRARTEERLEGGLDHVMCLQVVLSQKTPQLPEEPIIQKYNENDVRGVREGDPFKLRELGHRCVCAVGPGVIVLERYFFRSEKRSIDRFFKFRGLQAQRKAMKSVQSTGAPSGLGR